MLRGCVFSEPPCRIGQLDRIFLSCTTDHVANLSLLCWTLRLAKKFKSLHFHFLGFSLSRPTRQASRPVMIKGKVLYVMHFFYSHISSFFFLPIYLTASKRRGEKKKRVLMCGCRPPKEAKLRSPKIKNRK